MSKSTEKLFALRDVIRSMKLSSAKINLEAAFADYLTALVEEQNDPEDDDRK